MTPQYADGYLLYVRPDSTLVAVPFDAGRVVTTGLVSRFPIGSAAPDLPWPGSPRHRASSCPRPAPRSHLVEVLRDGIPRDARRRLSQLAPSALLARRHVVMDLTAGGTERDVWMFDRRLKLFSRVTHLGDAHDPTWLSDGAQVSFFSFKSQGGPLMIAAADGGSEPRAGAHRRPIRPDGAGEPGRVAPRRADVYWRREEWRTARRHLAHSGRRRDSVETRWLAV